MNARELYDLKDDGSYKPTGVYYCGSCRRVSPTLEDAETCCTPRLCSRCGGETKPYIGLCAKCRRDDADAQEREKREARAAKSRRCDPAENLSGWWFDDESNQYHDGGIEEVLCEYEEGCEPDVLYFCHENSPSIDAGDIMDRLEEEADCEHEWCLAENYANKLQPILDEFCRDQLKDVRWYTPDYSRCVETGCWIRPNESERTDP